MKITMAVETKRAKHREIREFNSTVDALNYMKKKGVTIAAVQITQNKNGKSAITTKLLSTRTMGYI